MGGVRHPGLMAMAADDESARQQSEISRLQTGRHDIALPLTASLD
jgi:hypothetical protein